MGERERYYSIPEAARNCGVSRTTMWNWVKSGHINAYVTPGGHHRILQEEIERVLVEGRITATRSAGPKTVLLVDDDPEVIQMIQTRLAREAIRSVVARDGFEAGMKLLSDRPDLVLLDLYMPGLDGFQVCKTIKESPELRAIKVLIVTGFDTAENRRRAMALGADAYLPKSMDPGRIVKQVGEMLAAE